MNVYSIHFRDSANGNINGNESDKKNQTAKLVLVKDGYCLSATAFGPLWALVMGLWELALLIFVFQVAVGFLINEFVPGANAAMVAQVGIAVLIGIVANELRRWNLARQGFEERATVLGNDSADAERRFFEANPHVLAQLEGAA